MRSSSCSGPVSDVVRWGTMACLDSPREGQFTRFTMLEFAMTPGHTLAATVTLLVASNLFMTFAWYGHLKYLHSTAWYVAAVASWGIALFEYLLQVPANRIGFQAARLEVGELKIMQEVITLAVFVPFSVFFLKQSLRLDYLWAALCMLGAVYFI